jgi:hypothetical protein
MISIVFPQQPFRIRKEADADFIFDCIRKRWVKLTPEEWVRQNILQYLLLVMKYPASLIAIEKEIALGELKKRCDIVVYDRQSKPWMIIECKGQRVPLAVDVLEQVLRYHSSIPAPYIIITNGDYCYGYERNGNDFIEMVNFPIY